MHVAELFSRLLFGPHVEVVVAALPELPFRLVLEFGGDLLFEDLDSNGQRFERRLVEQQMNMLRHENVSSDHETITERGLLQLGFEDCVAGTFCQSRLAPVTTEGQEMKDPAVLVTDKTFRHGVRRILSQNGWGRGLPPLLRKNGAPRVQGWATRPALLRLRICYGARWGATGIGSRRMH